jgi:hypothetical protein
MHELKTRKGYLKTEELGFFFSLHFGNTLE